MGSVCFTLCEIYIYFKYVYIPLSSPLMSLSDNWSMLLYILQCVCVCVSIYTQYMYIYFIYKNIDIFPSIHKALEQ